MCFNAINGLSFPSVCPNVGKLHFSGINFLSFSLFVATVLADASWDFRFCCLAKCLWQPVICPSGNDGHLVEFSLLPVVLVFLNHFPILFVKI